MLTLINLTGLTNQFVTPERITLVIRIVLILIIGIPLLRVLKKVMAKLTHEKLSAQAEQLIQRSVYYFGVLILIVSILNEFGFKLSALLGAAGVLGIAIGFASQTSVSNIISGIFLISEKPFTIGDIVESGSTIGIVTSIDLLSIKLITFDNKFVRIPNETMIKTEVTNYTKFPTRRLEIMLSVAYKEDLERVSAVLYDIAINEELSLKDQEPVIQVREFADSGINILFGIWTKTDDFIVIKNKLMIKIKQRFDAEGIEIPFPHLSLYAGEASKPLTIKQI
ncbi:MAG: mechanosensitive ion channel family protein [Candidatus Cloacimonetes bacterium HGW-Cloacimonetes-1]|jgi:small-conductance mechanosensitive channel|nr:MAG: mechanosensitive ion channel family protein [Candidatus Cloacimonetes bacterium HGW-Cloacimonetes-1]